MAQQYRHSSLQRGFTLIEVLAVVFLIGVAMAAITVSVGGGQSRELKSHARYLYNAMHMALEEAVITQSQVGVRFDVEGMADELQYRYRFLVLQPQQQRWLVLPADIIKSRALPQGVELQVRVDGQLIIIGAEQKKGLFSREAKTADEKEGQAPVPDIYFLSSGEMPDFDVTLRDAQSGAEYTIKGNMLGQLSLVEPHEQED